MAKNAAGKAGGGGGTVEPEGAGQPAAADSGRDGALQPGEAHPGMGEEVALRLVRVTKTRKGQVLVNKLTGEVQLWEERQEYIPTEEDKQ